jgi:two-component system response regulator MprA
MLAGQHPGLAHPHEDARGLTFATTVGLCEDDDRLRGALRDTLAAEGYTVIPTTTGGDAVRRFGTDPPDVIVLDIGLPDADGRDVCQALRARGVVAPVLFLTARDALPDRLSGFNSGGDDYLTKPFATSELLVRLRSLLRRAPAVEPPATASGLILDPVAHGARAGGLSIPLTPTEFRILATLVARPGEVVRRRELVAAAWPDGAIVHDNTLDSYVARIRRKLAGAGLQETIETARGIGYRTA